MITLLAAEGPAERTRAPASLIVAILPTFADDATRYVWIAAEYRRRLKSPVNKAKLVRDLGAQAFGISLGDLCGKSRKTGLRKIRHQVACLMRLLSGASYRTIGILIARDHVCAVRAHRMYTPEINTALAAGGRK